MNCTGLDRKKLLERTATIITTLGEQGSRISTRDGETSITAIKPEKVVDPTGAGDAYRAGLIKGLIQGKNIEEGTRMGSACASFAVESYGTQEHYFNLKEFEERLRPTP